MAPKPGYLEKIYAKASNATAVSGDLVDGIKDFTFSRASDVEETTTFKDGSGYKSRIQKLKDTSVDMSGQYESGDAVQQLLRSSYVSGATVYITVNIDPSAAGGSQGWLIPMLVESYDSKGTASGVAEFSCKLAGNGAPSAV